MPRKVQTIGVNAAGAFQCEKKTDPDDEQSAQENESMGVKREDEMLDVKALLEDVENLKDEREERNAAEHHRREICNQRLEKRSPRSPVGPIFSFALRFTQRPNAGLLLSSNVGKNLVGDGG